MKSVLAALYRCGEVNTKSVILSTEGISRLPDRATTKRLYTYTRSALVRLVERDFVERSDNRTYRITEKGKAYYLNFQVGRDTVIVVNIERHKPRENPS